MNSPKKWTLASLFRGNAIVGVLVVLAVAIVFVFVNVAIMSFVLGK